MVSIVKADLKDSINENFWINFKTDQYEWICQKTKTDSQTKTSLTPEELILSSFIASSLIELKLFLQLHGLERINISIEASIEIINNESRITQTLIINDCEEIIKEKLLEIVQNSSIHKLLGNEIQIISILKN